MNQQTVKMETITPSQAEEFLKLNTNNRKVRRKHVYFLRDEIQNGRWQANGATVVFSNNRLLDGQHRLLACIAAKKPIQSLVVREVPDEHFDTIDIGKTRTVGDVLSMKGETLVYRLSPTLSIILKYRDGTILESSRTSTTRAMQFLADNPTIRESIQICNDIRIMSVSVAAACHFLFKKKDAEMANEFIDGMRNGFEKDERDPFYDFRKRMLDDHRNKLNKPEHTALNWKYQMAFMICAWNERRQKRNITKPIRLSFGQDGRPGAHKATFPEII